MTEQQQVCDHGQDKTQKVERKRRGENVNEEKGKEEVAPATVVSVFSILANNKFKPNICKMD